MISILTTQKEDGMQYCSECQAVEQGTVEVTDLDNLTETIEVCACCEMEGTMVHVNEDAGKDR